jgi:hypothetical protein
LTSDGSNLSIKLNHYPELTQHNAILTFPAAIHSCFHRR